MSDKPSNKPDEIPVVFVRFAPKDEGHSRYYYVAASSLKEALAATKNGTVWAGNHFSSHEVVEREAVDVLGLRCLDDAITAIQAGTTTYSLGVPPKDIE